MLVALSVGCGSTSKVDRGRAVFRHDCSGCHTVTGRDRDVPGGDLAIAKLDASDIASFVRVMPVRLSAADVDAVAAYVHATAAKAGR